MTHQRWPSRGGVFGVVVLLPCGLGWVVVRSWLPQAGITKPSPRLSTAQAMRAFFAAMATTAFQ